MEYLIHILILFCIFAILALSLNLVVGFAGLVSVAHAAFFGIGAYTCAILLTRFNLNFFLSLICAILVGAFLSLLIGLVLSKFKGDYFVLGSLGFNVIIFSVFLNWESLTRGPLGIPGISRPMIMDLSFYENILFLSLAVVFLALVYIICDFIIHSSFGRVLKAIREDEQAIQVFGVKTQSFKLAIFVIGAAMAGLAGSLFASYLTFIGPTSFTLNESVFMLAIIILGGLANLNGAVLGALILIFLPEALRFLGFPAEVAAQLRQAIYGLILIALMLFRPQGLMGEYRL